MMILTYARAASLGHGVTHKGSRVCVYLRVNECVCVYQCESISVCAST